MSNTCGGLANIGDGDASIVERKPIHIGGLYEEIKLRKKEELKGLWPLNTEGTKLSKVRWLKAMCVAAKCARAVTTPLL
jgi:hypothetical protein